MKSIPLCKLFLLFFLSLLIFSCSEDSLITLEEEVIDTEEVISIDTTSLLVDTSIYSKYNFSDKEVASIIEKEMRQLGAFMPAVDYSAPDPINGIQFLRIQTQWYISAQKLNDPEGNLLGAMLIAQTQTSDQLGNPVELTMLNCVNFRNSHRFGSIAVKSPGRYFVRLDQKKTNKTNSEGLDFILNGHYEEAVNWGMLEIVVESITTTGIWEDGLILYQDLLGPAIDSDNNTPNFLLSKIVLESSDLK